MGMRPIIVDSGLEKSKLSKEMGSERFVDFKEHAYVGTRVREIADSIGAHGVLVTPYQAYKDALSYIGDRVGSKIMCIALPPAAAGTLGINPSFLTSQNVSIVRKLVGMVQDTADALDYAERGLLKGIAEIRRFSRFNESVQSLRRREIAGRVVIDSIEDNTNVRRRVRDA